MLIDWESGKKFIEGSVMDPDPLHPKINGLLDPITYLSKILRNVIKRFNIF